MQESMTILVGKLSSLAGMRGENLNIKVDGRTSFGVEISVGEDTYYAETLSTESLSSALLHLSMLGGAKAVKPELEDEKEEKKA